MKEGISNTHEEPQVAPEAASEIAPQPEAQEELKVERFEDLPKDEQEKLLVVALEELRQGIGDVKDYAVFASTAMYLNGERMVASGDPTGKALMAPPGDFDAAVFSEESLRKLRDRLGRMENVEFDNGGKFIEIPGEEMKKLAGKLMLEVGEAEEKKRVAYDFEFFYKSRVVSPELANGRTIDAHGLKALNLDGLQGQYERNLQFEGRIDKAVKEIVDYLHSDDESAKALKEELYQEDFSELSEGTARALERLKMSPEDMKEVLALQENIDGLESRQKVLKKEIEDALGLQAAYESIQVLDHAREEETKRRQFEDELKNDMKTIQGLVSERATLLAGTKTKLWKRQLNVLQLARARGRE